MEDDADVIVDIESLMLCRLCISNNGKFLIGPAMQGHIKSFFDISISSYDGLSQILCDSCKSLITNIVNLKNTFGSNQNKLLQKQRETGTGTEKSCAAQSPLTNSTSFLRVLPIEKLSHSNYATPLAPDIHTNCVRMEDNDNPILNCLIGGCGEIPLLNDQSITLSNVMSLDRDNTLGRNTDKLCDILKSALVKIDNNVKQKRRCGPKSRVKQIEDTNNGEPMSTDSGVHNITALRVKSEFDVPVNDTHASVEKIEGTPVVLFSGSIKSNAIPNGCETNSNYVNSEHWKNDGVVYLNEKDTSASDANENCDVIEVKSESDQENEIKNIPTYGQSPNKTKGDCTTYGSQSIRNQRESMDGSPSPVPGTAKPIRIPNPFEDSEGVDEACNDVRRATRNATKYNCMFCIKVTMDGSQLKRHIHTHHTGLLDKLKSLTNPCSVRLKNISSTKLPKDWVHFDSNKVYQYNPKDTYFFLSKRRNAINPDLFNSSSDDDAETDLKKNYKSMKQRRKTVSSPLSSDWSGRNSRDSLSSLDENFHPETTSFITDKLTDGTRWPLLNAAKNKYQHMQINSDSEADDEEQNNDIVFSPLDIEFCIKSNLSGRIDVFYCNFKNLVQQFSNISTTWQRSEEIKTAYPKKQFETQMCYFVKYLPAYDDINRRGMNLLPVYYKNVRQTIGLDCLEKEKSNEDEVKTYSKVKSINKSDNKATAKRLQLRQIRIDKNTNKKNKPKNTPSTIKKAANGSDNSENVASNDVIVAPPEPMLPLLRLTETLSKNSVTLVLSGRMLCAKKLLKLLSCKINIGTTEYTTELLLREDVAFILVVLDKCGKAENIAEWPADHQIQLIQSMQTPKFLGTLKFLSGRFGKFASVIQKLIEILNATSIT